MSRVVGFTRALGATDDTETDAAELTAAGVSEVFVDGSRGRGIDFLKTCLTPLSPGDELVVTRSARLCPTVGQFISTIAQITQRGIRFTSLAEPALSCGGPAVPSEDVFVAIANLRGELIGFSTKRLMTDASALGRRPGRPTVMTEERTAIARELRAQNRSINHIAHVLGVSNGAVRRVLANGPIER